ncbi:MAG TPA: potassium-transporting ATPase subunit KdpA [Candidatus Dormibacteraeota bacterium]|jgi:K+-transporting ATPase ATPase A chain|nr:potassium-transporting ATPase subunit KdpA [Candidatus Dormibacteraeota bacterium]
MTRVLLGLLATVLVLGVCAYFLGVYMEKVFTGQRTFASRVLRPVEVGAYKLIGIREDHEQSWVGYLVSMFVITVVGVVVTYLVLRFQDHFPLNPQGFGPVAPDLAFNTAISFATNTNWQNYAGEQTMSYFSQMVALVLHQFLSAATGIVLAIALVRGLSRRSASTIGSFYVDAVRCLLYVLLPLSFVTAVGLVSQGSIQNFSPYTVAHTLQGATQTIAQGPVASMEAIKDLGTNGGGFFNANSAHPFENPNPLTNQLEIVMCLVIAFGLTITFGRMVGNIRQGVAVAAAMAVILLGGAALVSYQEQTGNPALTAVGVNQARGGGQAGGNMEGKRVDLGPVFSAAYGSATTATSTGAVDSSHDSYTPLGGMVFMIFMKLGEITPGGVGSGLYGMLVFAIVAVFIAGLMVGRTPEYLGKKIEARDIKFASLAILILPATILGFTAVSVLIPAGKAGPLNPAAHGFSEILYAFTSNTGNNGSAFAGLSGNTLYYNTTMAAAEWLGRFVFIIPVLALAGSMVKKKIVPASAGTFPTDTPLFTGLLVGVVLIVGALTFFPALALGPILEHLQLQAGQLFK